MAPNHRWEKLEILGSGSFGTVSLARKTGPLGSRCFLAAVKSSCLDQSSTLQIEAKYLRQFKGSPYVVQCFGEDVSVEKGVKIYNLLLEFASNGTLTSFIEFHNDNHFLMPEDLVSFYTHQLLNALHHIHIQGFVHCDIKPDNILLFPTHDHRLHRLKIADFGLAKKLAKAIEPPRRQRYIRGTPVYASPESICGGDHQTAMDIWAFGCVVLQMFTGRKSPWKYLDVNDLFKQIVETDPNIPEWISASGKDFLKRCFEKDPSKRWSAQLLLNHPFITKNNLQLPIFHGSPMEFTQTNNPFGGPFSFVSKNDLFSDTSATTTTTTRTISSQGHEQEEDAGCYQLFGGSLVCGDQLVKQILQPGC